jgi:hemerythrin
MALLTWSDGLSVGVKAMDEQHKILVEILNELHTAMMDGQAHAIAGALLDKLVDYTHFHFACEEKLIGGAQFPGLALHRQQHQDLTKEVEVFVARYRKGEEMLTLHLMNFLRDWLSNHILEEDKQYGLWLNQHGVS